MKDRQDLAVEATSPLYLRVAGMVRRMAVTLTTKALWQLAGFRQLDGTTETRQVEPFPDIGYYSRPSTSGSPEAIVLMVDGKNPVIVALRDEKTRAAAAGGLQPNETAMFNDAVIAIAKANGTYEIRSLAGVAAALALADELATLVSTLAGVTPGLGSGDAAIAALQAYVTAHPTYPVGTTKLKAE